MGQKAQAARRPVVVKPLCDKTPGTPTMQVIKVRGLGVRKQRSTTEDLSIQAPRACMMPEVITCALMLASSSAPQCSSTPSSSRRQEAQCRGPSRRITLSTRSCSTEGSLRRQCSSARATHTHGLTCLWSCGVVDNFDWHTIERLFSRRAVNCAFNVVHMQHAAPDYAMPRRHMLCQHEQSPHTFQLHTVC
jgi:hypothetical protein